MRFSYFIVWFRSLFSLFTLYTLSLAASLTMGDDAPDFSLVDQKGSFHRLRDHRGQFVFLVFYPKTSDCHSIKLLKSLQSLSAQLQEKNVVIYALSGDTGKLHNFYHNALSLSFDLLSDFQEIAANSYEANHFWGRRFISYLVGPDGRIFRKYADGRAIEHPRLALQDL